MRFREFARIDELAGAKSYGHEKIKTLAELDKFMAQFGFSQISNGEFSMVFENPRLHQVVKVYNDECYDHFIEFCKANRGNPHLPKFKGNSIRLRSDARMIRIERLEPTDSVYLKAQGFYTLRDIARSDETWSSSDSDTDATWHILPEQELLLKTLKMLYEQKGSCWVDLNPGNIMLRGATLVIVDPYAPDRNGWSTTNIGS